MIIICFIFKYNHVPRQIVTPYKPSEDIEQTPLLLPPTPTSPDSLQTASGYFPDNITPSTNHSFVNSDNFGSAFNFNNDHQPTSGFSSSNPFVNHENTNRGAFTNINVDDDTYPKVNFF